VIILKTNRQDVRKNCKVFFYMLQNTLEKEGEIDVATLALAGTRIRDRRTARGIRQAQLARDCEISPSYLNLIEHNRRNIGGALLVRIAKALDTDPAALSEGAETALTTELEAAALAQSNVPAERDRLEEMTARFPGWSRLIVAQFAETRRLEQVVERMDDRLTHDPFLSASMHSVLTSVSAIRSASAILASGEKIEPEWQMRFSRNIYEDSQHLAEATETLVGYLDADEASGDKVALPHEEVERWLDERGWQIGDLEADPSCDIDEIIVGAGPLQTTASRDLARRYLIQYRADVQAVPLALLKEAFKDNTNPIQLAGRLNVPLPLVFRRLAARRSDELPDGVPFGLVGCDASGTLIFRKPVAGFEPPRYGGACPLWPLFRALQTPLVPFTDVLSISGRDDVRFDVQAVSEVGHPLGYDRPATMTSWMLVHARPADREAVKGTRAGITCRVCAETNCPTRREPSVFAGFGAKPL
jgi:transcriptional regulator with XRE-family HTH domain